MTDHIRRSLPRLLAALALPMLLGNLGELTLRQWDEARQAVSAWEMTQTGRWLVVTFEHQPDLWSTKPPLLVWVQAGLLRLLGPTEWAIRLPAAVAGLATVAVLYRFAARTLGLAGAGFMAGVVLLSSQGFAGEHVARTGDYDAPLIFFQLLFATALFQAVEVAVTPVARTRAWLLAGLALALAVLTKGIAAALPLVGVAVWCMLAGRWRRIVRAPGFWLALGIVVTVAGTWYGVRERAGPGYWAAVWANELGGRFGTTLEAHSHPWYWYLEQMNRRRFLPWVWLLPITIPFALRHPDVRVRHAAILGLCWAVGLLLVISVARTKLHWYPAPAYPWLALLIALGLPGLRAWVLTYWRARVAAPVMTGVGALLLVVPYTLNLSRELRRAAHDTVTELSYGYGLRAAARLQAPPTPLVVLVPPGYNASLGFYLSTYPGTVRRLDNPEIATLRPDEYVLTCNSDAAVHVRQMFPTAVARQLMAPPLPSCELFTLTLLPPGLPADTVRP